MIMGLGCFKACDIRGKLGDEFNLSASNTGTRLCPNVGACRNEALLGTRVTELATPVGG